MNEFAHKGTHGDHTFCFEFAERHMNRPLPWAGGAKAVRGQIGTLTDAHAGVANQQEDVAAQVIALAEFLLQEFILFCREWTRKSLREARNILAADQMSKFRKLFGPGQFVADAAQTNEAEDIGCSHERRHLRVQAGQLLPPETKIQLKENNSSRANQIAALAATVTVEEIFASVDVERRPGFRMQWAESNELGPESDRPGGPTLLLQIIEQRQTLFQLFDILAHGAVFPLEANVGEGGQHSQARMVGGRKFLRAAGAKEFAEPESAKSKAQLPDRSDHRAPTTEPCRRAFGGERKQPVESGPVRGPSGEVWKDRARGQDL